MTALTEKYRPTELGDVIGQTKALDALRHAIGAAH